MKSFIKWAGGKSSVYVRFEKTMPKKIRKYVEPFLGSGAVFLQLVKNNVFEEAVLSDNNPELINTWRVLQSDVDELIAELRRDFYTYVKSRYLEIRNFKFEELDPIKNAARFIYLNKTSFNGLYRVNSSGRFNVPFGKYNNPTILDETTLKTISGFLQKNVTICLQDFEKSCTNLTKEDFVYFDPPYLPISKTSSFSGYTGGKFLLSDHERLAQLFKNLGDSGIPAIVSNSFSPMIVELYGGYSYDTYMGKRSIAGATKNREPKAEILVWNYTKPENKTNMEKENSI